MNDREQSPLQAQIAQAVEIGDVKEVEALSLKGEHVEWIRKQAFKDVRELVKSETGWPVWRILVHMQALVGRLEMQLRVAKADRNSLRRRIAELEVRTGELRMNGLAYRGVFRAEDVPYRVGDIVTDRGTLWYCDSMTHERPPADSWKLMVKTKHG